MRKRHSTTISAKNGTMNSNQIFFAEDIPSISVTEYKLLDSNTRRKLCDLLRERGVYVPEKRNAQIASSLHPVAKEDPKRPGDDKDRSFERSRHP